MPSVFHTDFKTLPFPTNADFSSSEYKAVLSTGSDTDIASNGNAAITGFLQADVADYSSGTDRKCSVAVSGRVHAIAGAAIATMGTLVMPTTAGKVIAVTDGNYFCGKTLSTPAADGDGCLIQLVDGYFENS